MSQVDCSGTTISAALRDLQPGDTLRVRGLCKESVTIPAELTRITLDGQVAATIQHPGPAGAAGPGRHVIYIRGTGITVTGFTVTGGSDGIHLSGPAQAVIDGNTIVRNAGRGIHVDKGSVAQIVNNTIRDNRGSGIHGTELSYARIGFSIPPDARLGPNTVERNGGDGIRVERSSGAWIVGNIVRWNQASGIAIDRGSQADVVGNAIAGNRGDAITATYGSGVNLRSESTPRREGPNHTDRAMTNGGVGIRCSIGGYVAGPLGTLDGARGAKAFDSTCTDRVIR